MLGTVLIKSSSAYVEHPELSQQHTEWAALIPRYGPSYSFVVLCEFLALFMFRYQSKALEYMRYFSNEATNIDARHIAFISALHFMDKTKIGKLIEKLDATERNFLINKDQRTLEMANNENEDRLLDRVKSLLNRRETGTRPK